MRQANTRWASWSVAALIGTTQGLFYLATLIFLAGFQPAQGAQVVSTANPNALEPAGGNGPSVSPQVTPDGRFVLFTSSASDLVTNGNGSFTCNLFLRDRSSNVTTLVSANFRGACGNGDSLFGQVSTNGRFVVFQSTATDLVAGDTNGASDIFERDLASGTTALVSVAADGGFGNGPSTDPVMTPDGRFVVFVSAASNLVAGDTNGLADIFVRDTVNNTTVCVTTGATVANRNFFLTGIGPLVAAETPVITPDGRFVAFVSTNDLGLPVPFQYTNGVPYGSYSEVYVRDLAANTTTWVSSNMVSLAFSNITSRLYLISSHPAISDDGTQIAFKTSVADHLGPTAVATMNLPYDLLTLVSTNSLPAGAGIPHAFLDDDFGPAMTPDGRFIAYGNRENGTNCWSIHLWDSLTATDAPVSVDLTGAVQTNAYSHSPVLTPDGRFVSFVSNATNLVGNAVSSGYHLYLRDEWAGTNQLIDADPDGAGSSDQLGAVPSLSDDGRFVAFSGPDGRLVPRDSNGADDVFVRDTANAAMELVSQRSAQAMASTGNGSSALGRFAVSADGRWVAFASFASDLVTNDFNNDRDVFVTDLQSGTVTLVSVGLDGNAGLGGGSSSPAISGDGRFVAFVSAATNLVANDTNGAADIFLRDRWAGTTTLVSVNASGNSLGTGDAGGPAISQDGRFVTFQCKTTPSAVFPSTYWRDTVSNRTSLVSPVTTLSNPTNGPSISANGQRVLWFDPTAAHAFSVWDAGTQGSIYGSATTVSSAALSPNGTRVVYQAPSAKELFVYDLAGKTNLLVCTNTTPIKGSSPWSSDGRFVAFSSGAALAPGDQNGTNDVYLCDLQTGTLTLVSGNMQGTGSANGPSDWPAVSGDGRFTVFRSWATDVAPGITSAPSLILFDRATGSNSVMATGVAGSWSSWISQPTVSSNDASVVFQSFDSSVEPGDLNRVQDVFAAAENPLIADSDGDGIPDWWMIKYFGHPTGEASDSSMAYDDPDGDGMSNLQEYLAGTDPTDPSSVLAVRLSPIITSGARTTLSWPALAGRSYQVQYKDDLSKATWTNYAGNVFVLGAKGSVTVTAAQAARFYRVVCGN